MQGYCVVLDTVLSDVCVKSTFREYQLIRVDEGDNIAWREKTCHNFRKICKYLVTYQPITTSESQYE
jgi:hypothetical protein